MKRFLPYILIVLIFVQLLAPFSVGSGVKIERNTAEAEDIATVTIMNYSTTTSTLSASIKASSPSSERSNLATVFDSLFLIVTVKKGVFTDISEQKIDLFASPNNLKEKDVTIETETVSGLTEKTTYVITAIIEGTKDGSSTTVSRMAQDLITNGKDKTDIITKEGSYVPDNGDISGLPTCFGVPPGGTLPKLSIPGCIAQGIYYLFFKTTSLFFALTGKILDFTLMYSISDTSYRSTFVVEGWGIIRDFCNMFFIFIMLYIAFGTILKLHGVKTKEMIINVVIIGLLINFSLFATQVIIDASNILTRVFYNQNSINTGVQKKDKDGKPIVDDRGKPVLDNKLGDFNEIKLSEAIVSKVNPVELITNASKANSIPTKDPIKNEEGRTSEGITTGNFVIVTLLATVVNVVGSIAFLSSALIFIGRVVMLWLAMILAPIAFFTYTVPALQNIKMIGWKRWWTDTLTMAFVAPVFAFFMYIIVAFLGKGLDVVNASMKTGAMGLTWVISIIVPFIFIMILLMQAKKIAVNMSGEIGSALSKVGGAVGGIALGAVTGGAALAMRGTVGRLATNVAQSNKFRDWAGRSKIGASALKMTSGVASKSFDFRATKLGGMAGKELGIDLGKAKEGGFAKAREEKVHKEEEFAKKLLDTSDYGMAELQSGKMSKRKADRVIAQIQKSGQALPLGKNGKPMNEAAFRTQLVMGEGLKPNVARVVADQMSSARRSDRAEKLSTGIKGIFVTNKIAANKIRKDPAALEKARNQATMLAQLVKDVKASNGEHKIEEHKTTAKAEPVTTSESHNTPSEGSHDAGHHT
jgi:hypothetical protein